MFHCLKGGAIFAIEHSYLDLLDTISQANYGSDSETVESYHREAEQFIVALIASVVLADGNITIEEVSFLEKMLHLKEKPGGAVRYVNEYAAKWCSYQESPPRFLMHAIKADLNSARTMMSSIQTIGNNVAISDGNFAKTESKVVRNYLKILETQIETARDE